jgi:hypothetical protein
MPVALTEAWKRDAQRESGVGHEVIYRQYQQWNEFVGRRKYVPDASLPSAYLVDIDGTLAHMSGRSPYDWNKVHTDTPDKVVRDIVNLAHASGKKIVIVSGRDGGCYDITKKWLVDNEIQHDLLLMRKAGDNRADTIVKEEILWADIAPFYNVECVIDDRPVVVRTWIDLGIKTICVGDPWLEF